MFQKEDQLYFDTSARSYVLIFKDKKIYLRLCEFIALHQRLSKLDLEMLLNDLSTSADNHKFVFHKNSITLFLNLIEVIRLRNLFCEAMFMMRLQDLLYNLSIQLPITEETLELA
ncbi:MAG TPA: hypothetical protein VL947_14320 [Cytophagales bacterium]|nr:hypothetical protein [Cytophagales bacterium]